MGGITALRRPLRNLPLPSFGGLFLVGLVVVAVMLMSVCDGLWAQLSQIKIGYLYEPPTNNCLSLIEVPVNNDGSAGAQLSVDDNNTTNQFIGHGQRVWHNAFIPHGKYLLVANWLSDDIPVVDVEGAREIESIRIGELPWGAAIGPN